MFVLCPHCQFLVALDPVSGAPPPVCPRCEAALQLSTAPIEAPQPQIEAPGVHDADVQALGNQHADDEHPVADVPASPIDDAPQAPVFSASDQVHAPEPETDAGETVPSQASAHAPAKRTRAPSFVRTKSLEPVSESRRRWPVPTSLVALTSLLLLQMLVAQRAQLAGDARWRPALSAICNVLTCTLPPWREPTAFTVLARDVRPRPDRAGVLHVTARFRNDARWPQPWPDLVLTLSDADGRIAGARRFSPHDYLPASLSHDSRPNDRRVHGSAVHDSRSSATTATALASGQSVDIVMDVIEPAPGAVAFTFDFL